MLTYEYKTFNFGMTEINYKVWNDTAYHINTPDRLVQLLHNIRVARTERIIIEYGDTVTGKTWGDKVTGYIGRSSGGEIHIPIIICNSRSRGGEGILDHCIVRMSYAKGKKVFYDITK